MAVDYNPRHLAMSIKRYFEQNHSALEVLIFKGSKIISIIREDTESYVFIRNFMMKYQKIKEPQSDSLKSGSIDKALPLAESYTFQYQKFTG